MDEKIKLFITFLKRHDCYFSFIYNLKNNLKGKKTLNDYLIYENWEDFISSAFRWVDTEEGVCFWCFLNRCWLVIWNNISNETWEDMAYNGTSHVRKYSLTEERDLLKMIKQR